MSRGIHPIDPGLQSERTLLAWQRTCLAMAAGYAVLIHFLTESLGPAAVVIGLVGLASVAATWVLPHRRYLRWRPRLSADPRGLRIGGVPLAAMTLAVIASGLTALLVVLAM